MKLVEAFHLMAGGIVNAGFRVSFNIKDGHFATSGHFPDRLEPMFVTEEEAWGAAALFARTAPPEYVDIYVIDGRFSPVKSYRERVMRPSFLLRDNASSAP